MLIRLENPKQFGCAPVQVSPAQLGEKTTQKHPNPFLNVFTTLVSFKFKHSINAFILYLSETRKGSLEEEGQKKRLFFQLQAASLT